MKIRNNLGRTEFKMEHNYWILLPYIVGNVHTSTWAGTSFCFFHSDALAQVVI